MCALQISTGVTNYLHMIRAVFAQKRSCIDNFYRKVIILPNKQNKKITQKNCTDIFGKLYNKEVRV